MRSMLLSGPDWTLTGYWQNQWGFYEAGDLGQPLQPVVPAIPATVPGAIHADLLQAGLIPDWQNGLDAAKSEWVNNREWLLRRTVTAPAEFDGRLMIECDGLDYSGLVLVNGKQIGTFEGTHIRHRFDLSGHVQSGDTFDLGFLFHLSPSIEGVFGYTSKTKVLKPRFGYCWDWCPRLVNVGIWQDVRLVSRGPVSLEHCRVLPRVSDDLAAGSIWVHGDVVGRKGKLRYELRDDAGAVVKTGEQAVGVGPLRLEIPVEPIKLWWPATHGRQPLYHLRLELRDGPRAVSDVIERTVGFRRVRWLANPGGPTGAKPYVCEVNGVPIFLRGINWVPLSPFYGTVTGEQYEAVLSLYQNMNVNVLRVWGGGILETPGFYERCDRLGLMVWQEFPLSSSGIENWPPEDPEVIEHLQTIGREYIERRAHHACHLLWCGGNELQGAPDGAKTGIGKPVNESHPLMARWQRLVDEIDPGKRFQASSPSGPTFYAHAEHYGKGIHHQTHGPWGNLPLAERYDYWNRDDSLFRSENGAPAASSLTALERRCGDQPLWPPRAPNRHWLVPGAAWAPWNDVAREFGEITDDPSELSKVVKASRYLQAESYRYAAQTARRRYPQCSGYIIWMGHDSVHITANNSVIQIDGSTKPAYDWLQRAYAGRHVSLRHDSISYLPGERIVAEAWIHRDDAERPAGGTVTVNLRNLDGRTLDTLRQPVRGEAASICAARIDWAVPECAARLFVVELLWDDGDRSVSNRYVLSQQDKCPLAPLLALPVAELRVIRESVGRVVVANVGKVAAVGVRLICPRPGQALLADVNNVVLLPGENQVIGVRSVPFGPERASAAALEIECFNRPGNLPVP